MLAQADIIYILREGGKIRTAEEVYKISTDAKRQRSTAEILVAEPGSATLSIFGAAANNKYLAIVTESPRLRKSAQLIKQTSVCHIKPQRSEGLNMVEREKKIENMCPPLAQLVRAQSLSLTREEN